MQRIVIATTVLSHNSQKRGWNPMEKKKYLFAFYYVFICFLLIFYLICLTKFESIKLKCYTTTLLYLRNCCEYGLLRILTTPRYQSV